MCPLKGHAVDFVSFSRLSALSFDDEASSKRSRQLSRASGLFLEFRSIILLHGMINIKHSFSNEQDRSRDSGTGCNSWLMSVGYLKLCIASQTGQRSGLDLSWC